MGADLAALGFTAQELAAALNQGDEGLTDEDEIPEVAESRGHDRGRHLVPRAAPHRLRRQHRCRHRRRRCSAMSSPQLMVTDPPYGVDYDPAWRHRAGREQVHRASARSATTSAPTGRRPGRCSPATSPTSGTARCTPRPLPKA